MVFGQTEKRMKHSVAARRLLLLMMLVSLAGMLVLSLMRDAKRDETLYLRDSAIMADCLRKGQWFGNEAVGVHGFVFKIPAALLFLVVGKSVYAATLVTVVLAMAACLLCFRFLRALLYSERWALGGTWLLAANFQFIRLTPTYNRDIAALFAVLFLLNAIIDHKGRWALGFLLLLILDAKEYLFFIILPPYLLWAMLDVRRVMVNVKRFRALRWLQLVLARWTAAVLPAAVYLTLMFCTSLVPLNMFQARILGLTETAGADTLADQFRPEVATQNPWPGRPERAALPSPTPDVARPSRPQTPTDTASRYLGLAQKYAAKLFYPGVFSFDGIPKALAFPAVAMSFLLFWRTGPQRNERRFLALMLWCFLLSFMAMPSYPRYLLPVYPVLFLLLILFLKDATLGIGFRKAVYIATCIFVVGGLYFSPAGLWKKIGVNAILLALLGAILFRWPTGKARERGATLFVALTGAFCILVSIRYTCLNTWGQVGNFLNYGVNRECRQVLAQFAPTDRFWLNDAGWKYLLDFYRGERPETPEWEGRLKAWVPKKRLLHHYDTRRAHDFWWRDIEAFRAGLEARKIERVGLVVSAVPDDPFPFQWWRDDFDKAPWLTFEGTVPMQNKMLYLYRYGDHP